MLKLFIVVSSLLLAVAAYPTLQLLAGLPSPEEVYSFTSFGQLQSTAVTTASSLGESSSSTVESTALPPSSSPSAPAAEEPSQSKALEMTESTSDDESSAQTSPATSLAIAPAGVGSLSSLAAIQHHLLPAEQIPLPITISTSPGLRTVLAPETITIHQPAVAKVGELVQKIPTAVSHQSQTVVHKHAEVITPIVAPAVRTITSQVVRAYHTPLVYAAHAPVIKFLQH